MTLTYADTRAGSHPFRHLLLALLVPLGLTAGLLTFPTVCACGEPLPHDHALFTLAGHHHEAHAHTHDVDAAEHGDAAELPSTPTYTAHTHGVALEAPTTNSSGESHALLPASFAETLLSPSLAFMLTAPRRADLWRGVPPAPPPRASVWHG
jgi:hypothetical protein